MFDPAPEQASGQHRAPGGERHRAIAAHASVSRGRSHHAQVQAALTAAVMIAAGATFAVRLDRHAAQRERAASSATAETRAPPLVLAAAAWLSTNLPHSAKVIADDTVRAALIGSGFPTAAVPQPRQVASCEAVSFVVLTRALATSAPAGSRCVRSGQPIAVFGSGPTAVRIDEIASEGSAALASRRAIDAHSRKRADTALATNPSVRTVPAVRAKLTSGELDLRAATVIAELAGHTRVRITAVTGVAAEIAAGLPARTVGLVLANPSALPPVLAGLSDSFRPRTALPAGPGSVRLGWPLRTDPIPTLK